MLSTAPPSSKSAGVDHPRGIATRNLPIVIGDPSGNLSANRF